ncbi:MAG: hypothetical protein H0W88_00835 [Parachlamydiaceae bacterium]|nr:hypothetical protein [Parachlamydiaceae bacterium]
MNCWKCGTVLSEKAYGKISFRATCEECDTDLHCCKNCNYYKPGLPNDCAIPGTDYVADRFKNNFCEEFSIIGTGPSLENKDLKNRFDDLFK